MTIFSHKGFIALDNRDCILKQKIYINETLQNLLYLNINLCAESFAFLLKKEVFELAK